MISSILTLVCALAGLILVRFARKPLTKMVTVMLALSSIIYLDPIMGIGPFGTYVFAFCSVLASVESANSLNLKNYHKAFLIGTAVVIVLITVSEVLGFDEMIPKYIFGMLYLLGFGVLFLKSFKKIKSRLGILVVWSAEAIKWCAELLA
jgi:hypothetical protein